MKPQIRTRPTTKPLPELTESSLVFDRDWSWSQLDCYRSSWEIPTAMNRERLVRNREVEPIDSDEERRFLEGPVPDVQLDCVRLVE